jgi:hypothetical protein
MTTLRMDNEGIDADDLRAAARSFVEPGLALPRESTARR